MATTIEPRQTDTTTDADADSFYEIVNGQRVEGCATGSREVYLANILSREIWKWDPEGKRGAAVIEILFRFTEDLSRRPDLAYVPFDRWQEPEIPKGPDWAVIPSLCVEVVSPSNKADDIQQKIVDYFAHGVNLVWVIYPEQQLIYDYTGAETVRIAKGDTPIQGGDALPGFSLPVRRLFEGLRHPTFKS